MMQLTLKNRILAQPKLHKLFEKTFGMWADRDVDIKKMRREAYEKRTKNYDNATL